MSSQLFNAAGLLLFNSGYIYRKLRKESERSGVRWTQVTLLKDIELQAPVTQKELAQTNHMSGPSVSVIVNEMIELGFVSRKSNPTDKRSSTLSLTAKGKQKLEKNGELLQACLTPMLSQLTSSEIKLLVEAESVLAKALTR